MSKRRNSLGGSPFPRILVWLSILACGDLACRNVPAEGIPEPPVLYYGEVLGVVSGSSVRLTSGWLVGTFQPSDAGPPVAVATELFDFLGQYSYFLPVPCESIVGAMSATTNTLRLLSPPATPITYTLQNISVDGQPAYLQQPSQIQLWMAATNRGLLRQVDLTLDLSLVDSDGDGIPDAWEVLFGLNPSNHADALLDSDLDGHNNLQEYFAGTSPKDPASVFSIVRVRPDPPNGVWLDWLSASNRVYVLERASGLLTEFQDIRADIPATPPVNTYLDATATGAGPVFYRLRIQQNPAPYNPSDDPMALEP